MSMFRCGSSEARSVLMQGILLLQKDRDSAHIQTVQKWDVEMVSKKACGCTGSIPQLFATKFAQVSHGKSLGLLLLRAGSVCTILHDLRYFVQDLPML